MTTRVVDWRKESYDVYIGRWSRFLRPNREGHLPTSFKWGNPFVEGKHGTREEVIAKYREWLLSNSELLKQLPELRGKTLGCWCKPKACHGDVLKELAEQQQLLLKVKEEEEEEEGRLELKEFGGKLELKEFGGKLELKELGEERGVT